MCNWDLDDEIAAAAGDLASDLDREIAAAGETFAAQARPPAGPLSQAAAAEWLGIPRRTLRSMIERGRLAPAEDDALYAADLREQLAAHRAARARKETKRLAGAGRGGLRVTPP